MVCILTENERSEEVDMSMEEVLRAVKWLVKERERIRLKSIRARRNKGIPARQFRPKPDPDAPVPEKRARGRPKAPVDPDAPKRPRGRPRKNPVPDIQVEVPPVPQEEPVVQVPSDAPTPFYAPDPLEQAPPAPPAI